MGRRKRGNKRINNSKDGEKVEEERQNVDTTWDDWWKRKEADLEERWRKRAEEVEEQMVSAAERAINERVGGMAVALKGCRKRQLEELEELWRAHEAALDAHWRSSVTRAVAHCTQALERQQEAVERKWERNEAAVAERWRRVVDGEIVDLSEAIDAIFKKYCDSSGDGDEKRVIDSEASDLEKLMLDASVNLQAPLDENAIVHIKKLLADALSFEQVTCESTFSQESHRSLDKEESTELILPALDKACDNSDNLLEEKVPLVLDIEPEKTTFSIDVSGNGSDAIEEGSRPVSDSQTTLRLPPTCMKVNEPAKTVSEESPTRSLDEMTHISINMSENNTERPPDVEEDESSHNNPWSFFHLREIAENTDCFPNIRNMRSGTDVSSEKKSVWYEDGTTTLKTEDQVTNNTSNPDSSTSQVSSDGIVVLETKLYKTSGTCDVVTDKKSTTANIQALSKGTDEFSVSQEGSVMVKTELSKAFEVQRGAGEQSSTSPATLDSVAVDCGGDLSGALSESESLSGFNGDDSGSKKAVSATPRGSPVFQIIKDSQMKEALVGNQTKHIEMPREEDFVESWNNSVLRAIKSKDFKASVFSLLNPNSDSSESEFLKAELTTPREKFISRNVKDSEAEEETLIGKHGMSTKVARGEDFMETRMRFIEAGKSRKQLQTMKSNDLVATFSSRESSESESESNTPGRLPTFQKVEGPEMEKETPVGSQSKSIEVLRGEHFMAKETKFTSAEKSQAISQGIENTDLVAPHSSSENSASVSSEAESTTPGVTSAFQKILGRESEEDTVMGKEGMHIEICRGEHQIENEAKLFEVERSQAKSKEITNKDLEASLSSNENNESRSLDTGSANAGEMFASEESKKSSDTEGKVKPKRRKRLHFTYTTLEDLVEQMQRINLEDYTSTEEESESEAEDAEDLATSTAGNDKTNETADQEESIERAIDGHHMWTLQLWNTMELQDRWFDTQEERERTARSTGSKIFAASPAAARASGKRMEGERNRTAALEKPRGSEVKDKSSDQLEEVEMEFDDRELSDGEMEKLLDLFHGHMFLTRQQRERRKIADAATAFAAAPAAARAQGEQLRQASRRRDVQRVLSLRAAGADPDAHDARGDTALHAAARAGRSDMVSLLLGRRVGASAGAENALGQTALHLAAARGCARCVAQLLSRGADVNAEDMFRRTPLHGAARWGRMAAARALLAAGARTSVVDERGKTPVDLAMSRAVVELLKVYEEAATSAKQSAASPGPSGALGSPGKGSAS